MKETTDWKDLIQDQFQDQDPVQGQDHWEEDQAEVEVDHHLIQEKDINPQAILTLEDQIQEIINIEEDPKEEVLHQIILDQDPDQEASQKKKEKNLKMEMELNH